MKEAWEYKKLGDVICHLRTGLNPRTHFKLNTSDADGYYITVRELKGFGIEPDEKTDKVNRAAIKRINERSNLKIGDVLFSGTGTIGKTALVSELPDNWNIKEGVYAMTPKHSELNSKWFIYYISSEFFLKLVNDKAAGTGVRNIPMKELVKLPIHLPPLSEQLSIVDYLDSAFAKIDAMKANAEKALNEAKSLFQASLKEMLEPKEGWKEETIEHFAKIVHGKNQKDVLDSNGLYPIYGSGGNIMGYANAYLCDEGTTILGRKGTIDNPLFINEKFWNVDTAFGIIAKDNCNKKFLYYSIKKIDWAKRNTGTTLPSLTQNVVYNVEMCAPSLLEQQAIVNTLDSLNSKVDRLQANYDKISKECDTLKQAILRQVFE